MISTGATLNGRRAPGRAGSGPRSGSAAPSRKASSAAVSTDGSSGRRRASMNHDLIIPSDPRRYTSSRRFTCVSPSMVRWMAAESISVTRCGWNRGTSAAARSRWSSWSARATASSAARPVAQTRTAPSPRTRASTSAESRTASRDVRGTAPGQAGGAPPPAGRRPVSGGLRHRRRSGSPRPRPSARTGAQPGPAPPSPGAG